MKRIMNYKQNGDYVNRYYRLLHEGSDLQYFQIEVKQSDLAIGVDKQSYTGSLADLCREEITRLRSLLEDYIVLQPEFQTSFVPVKLLPGAPAIAERMAMAAEQAGVGPMAAVAGAIAQGVGTMLDKYVQQVMVENGGDIYLKSSRERIVGVFAGKSKFSYKIGIRIRPQETPLAVCTSSGTVGPSISLGRADAAIIKAYPAELADAVATKAGNLVQTEDDLMKAIDYARAVTGVLGILIIKGEKMAVWGDMEIVPLQRREK